MKNSTLLFIFAVLFAFGHWLLPVWLDSLAVVTAIIGLSYSNKGE